jgi:MYXO-CTERM domain-containing protein
LQTCNTGRGNGDCPNPPGTLVTSACVSGSCQASAKGTCTVDNDLDPAECDDGNACTTDSCTGGACSYKLAAGAGCCSTADDCTAPLSVCQSSVSCLQSSCTVTVKTPLAADVPDQSCCFAGGDCSSVPPGVSCSATTNLCTCSGGKHYCGITPDNSAAEICVTGTQCCDVAACGPANGGVQCSDGRCTCGAGLTRCGSVPNITCQQCCGSDTSTCTGTLGPCEQFQCNSGTCTKVAKTGTGCCSGPGDPSCVNGTCDATFQCACASGSDTLCKDPTEGATCCAPVANGTISCSPPCTLTCSGGFHSCPAGNNNCVAAGDTSCGTSCKDCTSGLSSCQQGTCSSAMPMGMCSTSARNMAGCCPSNSNLTNCPVPSSCQTVSCDTTTNMCQVTAKIGNDCCSSANPCSGTASCGSDNRCSCASTPTTPNYCQSFGCAACCNDSQCTGAITNGNAVCDLTSHTCKVSTCITNFHPCTASNSCQPDTSTTACGAMCLRCAGPTNGCQTTVCASGSCGYTKSGASSGGTQCCNPATQNTDCVGNSCQIATCTNNQCVFTGRTNVAGCCNPTTVDTDCPTPTNPCLRRTCVENQCGTSVITGCVPDMSRPDMAQPRDMAQPQDLAPGTDLSPPRDLAQPLVPDLSRGRDLAAPGQLSVTGGGGCAVAGPATPTGLFILLAFTLSLALRRRRH